MQINGWIGKWDPDHRYVHAPMTIVTSIENVIIGENPRGGILTPYHTNEKGPRLSYDPAKREYTEADTITNPGLVQLKACTIDSNGYRYWAVVTGHNRVFNELALEKEEFNRIAKCIEVSEL